MLKKMCGLFLGLVVLAGSACVTPTHASSAHNIVITYIQAGGVTGAKEELVVLYNSSSEPVDMTDTCLTNKSNVAFACFATSTKNNSKVTYTVPSYGYLSIASEEYISAHSFARDYYSLVYTVTNQSSGSIVGSADSISLLDATGEVAASRTWTSALTSGKAWSRLKLISLPDIYAINNESTDWSMENASDPPQSALVMTVSPIDNGSSDNQGGTPENPPEEGVPADSNTEAPLVTMPPIITELLPNPAGVDADGEYIELYNPNNAAAVSLDGLRLRIGTDSPKWYSLPAGMVMQPKSYLSFSSNELGFTLVNTSGRVQLFRDTIAVGEAIDYQSPKDNQAWALIDGAWHYTLHPTPGAANELLIPDDIAVVVDTSDSEPTSSTPKPCAANQYRNPETGRCKLIASNSSATTPTPCKEGQERNPETNRCRNIASAATAPAPCKEGQERNPETGRCRAITKMTNADYAVLGVQTAANNQPRWYYWLAILIIVGLVMGYAIWEWRDELRGAWARLRGLVRK